MTPTRGASLSSLLGLTRICTMSNRPGRHQSKKESGKRPSQLQADQTAGMVSLHIQQEEKAECDDNGEYEDSEERVRRVESRSCHSIIDDEDRGKNMGGSIAGWGKTAASVSPESSVRKKDGSGKDDDEGVTESLSSSLSLPSAMKRDRSALSHLLRHQPVASFKKTRANDDDDVDKGGSPPQSELELMMTMTSAVTKSTSMEEENEGALATAATTTFPHEENILTHIATYLDPLSWWRLRRTCQTNASIPKAAPSCRYKVVFATALNSVSVTPVGWHLFGENPGDIMGALRVLIRSRHQEQQEDEEKEEGERENVNVGLDYPNRDDERWNLHMEWWDFRDVTCDPHAPGTLFDCQCCFDDDDDNDEEASAGCSSGGRRSVVRPLLEYKDQLRGMGFAPLEESEDCGAGRGSGDRMLSTVHYCELEGPDQEYSHSHCIHYESNNMIVHRRQVNEILPDENLMSLIVWFRQRPMPRTTRAAAAATKETNTPEISPGATRAEEECESKSDKPQSGDRITSGRSRDEGNEQDSVGSFDGSREGIPCEESFVGTEELDDVFSPKQFIE